MRQAHVRDPWALEIKLPEFRRQTDNLDKIGISEAIAREEAIKQLDLVRAMGRDEIGADYEVLSLSDGGYDVVVLNPDDVGREGAILQRVVQPLIGCHQPTIQMDRQGHIETVVDRTPSTRGDLEGRLQ